MLDDMTHLPDEIIYKIVDGAVRTPLYNSIARTVSERFRSIHYMSSILVAQCVLLNLLFNKEITPHSADRAIATMRRRTKSLYSTIDSSYKWIDDRFAEYAKTVLGNDYDATLSLALRNTEFIVYVISRDVANRCAINKNEIIYATLGYADIAKYKL